MKRKIITLLLAVAATSLISTTAMAADETISGFYDIGTTANVELAPYAGETAVTVQEKNIDEDEAAEQVYVGSNRLDVTYKAATTNDYYGIILVEGSDLPTKDTEIYYINQETASSSSVAYNVYPKLPLETTNMTLYISSSAQNFSLVSIPMNYAVNATAAPEECEHTWNDGVVTQEPTVDAEGVKTYTCTVCGEQKTEAIEKLPAPSYTPGDVNNDSDVSVDDVILVRRHITGGYATNVDEEIADVNKDNDVSVDDVILIRRYITGGYGVELK